MKPPAGPINTIFNIIVSPQSWKDADKSFAIAGLEFVSLHLFLGGSLESYAMRRRYALVPWHSTSPGEEANVF